ncbi:unnamed protein product [Ixodes persulcatus]
MLIRLLTLLAALVTCWAGPVPLASISEECRFPSSLKPQHTFLYVFQGENRIENKDAQHHVQFKTSVEIGTISPCLLSLKLIDVELHGVSVANRYAFKEALEKYPVLFHMEEGIIGDVRHDPSELPWAMNVKRAIMSMVQIPRTTLDANSIISETDIFGTCETKYSPVNGGILKKSKNLATCLGRFGSSLPIIYTPYESKNSPFQTIPMTNGTMDCQMIVDSNRWITKSECKEREFLRLAARGMAEETLITSTMVLILQQQTPGIKPVPATVNMMSSLKFDHSVTRVEKTDIKDVMGILRDLCRSTAEDIRPEASASFSRMVAALRGLPHEHLTQIYTKIVAGEICFDRKMEALYLDALPMIGTEASLKQTVELMNKAEHASRLTAWIAGLSSISYPTEGMISVLIPMVKKPNAPRNLILAVTSMAHIFCREESRNCDEVPAIKELQGALTKILSYKCRATDIPSRNKIITALKGFGNLGYYGEAINSIMECAIAANNPLPIRLAAIESFRRSCTPEVQSKLLELMKTTTEDVEIRIASYLGVMRCPSFEDIVEIAKMVGDEQSQQVTSFIMSHQRNLQETESPLKRNLRSLVSSLVISNKFDSDFRKSSQNIEWSEYSEKFNLGATADANIIYHPKSFIPRSLMMNLTVDLFSHSINLFEVGGRAEGYDHMLESLLAPKRQMENSHKTDSFWSRLGEKLRRSRRASPKTTKVNIMKPNQPSGSIYFKMFGNELAWFELPTMDDISNFADGVATNNWMSQLMNEKQMDIARSAMLIDTTVTVPTVTGFPFRADIKATVTAGLKSDGKLNLEGAPKDMLIEGFIKPRWIFFMSGNYPLNILLQSQIYFFSIKPKQPNCSEPKPRHEHGSSWPVVTWLELTTFSLSASQESICLYHERQFRGTGNHIRRNVGPSCAAIASSSLRYVAILSMTCTRTPRDLCKFFFSINVFAAFWRPQKLGSYSFTFVILRSVPEMTCYFEYIWSCSNKQKYGEHKCPVSVPSAEVTLLIHHTKECLQTCAKRTYVCTKKTGSETFSKQNFSASSKNTKSTDCRTIEGTRSILRLSEKPHKFRVFKFRLAIVAHLGPDGAAPRGEIVQPSSAALSSRNDCKPKLESPTNLCGFSESRKMLRVPSIVLQFVDLVNGVTTGLEYLHSIRRFSDFLVTSAPLWCLVQSGHYIGDFYDSKMVVSESLGNIVVVFFLLFFLLFQQFFKRKKLFLVISEKPSGEPATIILSTKMAEVLGMPLLLSSSSIPPLPSSSSVPSPPPTVFPLNWTEKLTPRDRNTNSTPPLRFSGKIDGCYARSRNSFTTVLEVKTSIGGLTNPRGTQRSRARVYSYVKSGILRNGAITYFSNFLAFLYIHIQLLLSTSKAQLAQIQPVVSLLFTA